jgi:septal ring factor EnvC (AmiA/AmiB activator)
MKFISSLALLAVASAEGFSANPIRRVVNMLQSMEKKLAEEHEKETDLMEKFQCYCKTNGGKLDGEIQAAMEKVPQLQSALESAVSSKKQMDEELVQHKKDRADAKATIETATAKRNEERAAFDKEAGDNKQNIAAMNSAINALEKGLGGFLQTNAASVLKKLVNEAADLSAYESSELTAFLQSGAAPAGGSEEIVGMLKAMKDRMDEDLGGIVSAEEAAQKAYDGMMDAKNKEIAAASQAIEEKTARSGELAVQAANLKNDLKDTEETLSEDQAFAAKLKSDCSGKSSEWEERQKTRAEEAQAIAETIKILNDDDALDLFKKTLSLIQMPEDVKAIRAKALSLIQTLSQSKSHSQALDFLAFALKGKSTGGFDKILKMIDDMVAHLKQEQKDDESHLNYCRKELDSADDKSKDVTRSMQGHEASISSASESIAQLADEIAALTQGIKDLDKQVADATEQRKAEHADFVDLMANNGAAKKLIEFAKNRMNKFYNPKLYKAPAARELSEEERVYSNMGGELAPTPAPGGIAGTGISVSFVQIKEHSPDCDCIGKNPCGCSGKTATSFVQTAGAPPPPPETFNAYNSKGQDSNGVIAMMDMLVKDLDTEMQEAEHTEKDSQKDYEELMAASADKRAADSKSITDKESEKADAEADKQSHEDGHAADSAELQATQQYIASLHGECDFLLNNFDLRKEARSNEIDGLKNAKAVLNGADYSLLQTASAEHGCASSDLSARAMFQNKLHGDCLAMCAAMGISDPSKCTGCPSEAVAAAVADAKANDGVMTWDELFAKYDELTIKGREQIKAARAHMDSH